MNWSVSVLTGLTYDTEPTILVTFDSAKYIFNVGENTNRAFLQSNRNWKKARAVFLTSVGTQRSSGLPGLLMTFADSGIGRLDVAGPYGLLHLLASARSFALRDTLLVNPIEVLHPPSGPEPIYKDENITVYATCISPSVQETTVPSSSSSSLKRQRSPSPESSCKRPMPAHDSTDSVGSPPPSIRHMMRFGNFQPRSLEGEDAQEWRREIIREMFSGKNAPQRETKRKSKDSENFSPRKSKSVATDGPEHSSAASRAQLDGRIVKVVPAAFNRPLPHLKPLLPHNQPPSASTLAYVLVGPRLRGKFSIEKAKALGIPNGHIRSRLTQGETVTFTVDDGRGGTIERVVRPEDCISKSEGQGVIVILDIPTRSHISSVINSFEDGNHFSRFRRITEDESEYGARTVFHICGDGVVEDSRYKEFMRGFGSDVYHVIASSDHNANPVTFTSAAFNTLRLHSLDPEMFPLPKFTLAAKKNLAAIESLPVKILPMDPYVSMSFRPYKPPARQDPVPGFDLFHPAVLSLKSLYLSPATLACFAQVKVQADAAYKHSLSSYPVGEKVTVVPLGTGSALPSKYRNVSSTLLQIPGWGNVLLEAGEGTWGQLVRHFGPDGIRQFLSELKCIFISHIHGDHHIGLAKILSMRRQLLPSPEEPLFLIAHSSILLYLYEYHELEDIALDDKTGNGVMPVLSDVLHWTRTETWQGACTNDNVIETLPWLDVKASQKAASALRLCLGLERITTVDVLHRTKCFGIVLRHTDGWSIVFSGDTMPSERLIREGQNATLLIHEATMADEQAEMAHAKAHSTFGQAVQVASRMNAKNLLLTHFSARYPKMPPSILSSLDAGQEPILGLAFDQARVEVGNMRKLCLYLPAIEQSFLDTKEEGDEDTDYELARAVETDIV